MRKSYTSTTTRRIAADLARLRKGSGLQADKLLDGPYLYAQLGRLGGVAPSALTPHSAYHLLLAEIGKLEDDPFSQSLRYAYALVGPAGTLAERRRELASKLHKHTDTIERYENQAFTRLAVRLQQQPAPSGTTANADHGATTTTATLRSISAQALGSTLGIPEHVDGLIQRLQSGGPPFLAASVHIGMTSSPRGEDWYRFLMRYTFSGDFARFRVAVVFSVEDGELLMGSGLIDEYSLVNDHDNPQREVRNLINNLSFVLYRPDGSAQKSITFSTLPEEQQASIFTSLPRQLHAPCRLVEATIPLDWRAADTRIDYRTSFDICDSLPYAYWYAPRLMHLHSLEWDYGRFAKGKDYTFRFVPMLGQALQRTSMPTGIRFSFQPTAWIMPSQGLVLTWNKPD